MFISHLCSFRFFFKKNSCIQSLETATLRYAYENRGRPQNLIFHSDRGAQYTSAGYVNLLRSLGITQSFSRSGSPYDNAVIESFFNLLKKEELHRRVYRSEQEFLRCVDEYISFYNSSRPHRYNNYKSPDSTEKLFEKSMLSADLPWRLQVQISCPFIDSYLFLRFNTKFVQLVEFVKSARKRCFYNKKLV